MSVMGIDVGTTGCKAGVFNGGGKCIAFAYREYPILHPREGWAELDSRAVMNAIREVVRRASSSVRRSDPVRALSISSLGEAFTPVRADGQILGNSILCVDTRGGDLLRKAFAGISQEAFYRINPNILGTNYSLPKMLWIKKHDPELFRRTDHFLLWSDMVAFALGCGAITSYSMANRTLLFDINRRDWSDKLLAMAGIDRARLPRLAPSGEIIGEVGRRAAEDFGLSAKVAVVLGGHDQSCNSLGAGVIEPGRAVCGLGSFECITPVFARIPRPERMLKCGLNIEHHVIENRYVSFLFNQGGLLVKWFRDTFASADRKMLKNDTAIYNRLNDEMPPAPTRLMALPYFDVTGPPDFVTKASGVIAGLKTSTRRGEILKALMEGETFYFVKSLESLRKMGIEIDRFTATGGGARSDRWLQVKADILGIPIARPAATEASVLGAAMLAGRACGLFRSMDEAIGRFVKLDRVFEPDAKRHAIYRERFELYRKFFPAMKSFLAALSAAK